jgi:hypothetical protein
MPSLNGKYEIAFKTSYKFYSADTVNVRGHTLYIHRVTFLNYLFYPLATLVDGSVVMTWPYTNDFRFCVDSYGCASFPGLPFPLERKRFTELR